MALVELLKSLRSAWGCFRDCLFPKVCDYCGMAFEEGLSNTLCLSCFNSIRPYQDPVCSRCGEPLDPGAFTEADRLRCAGCGEGEYFLDGVRAYGDYAGASRIAHHSFKFEGMEHLGAILAGRMVQAIPDSFVAGEAVFCPVPLSPERERERGYNPAELISRRLAVVKGLPVRKLLRKVKPVPPQMSLTREERLRNPEGAYESIPSIPIPLRVVLVDDVFTTGATLEECAKVLKKYGTRWVGAVVWGHTPRYF
jgi:ComF family protein